MYRWRDHTAELELEIEAASEHEVLSDALHALGELLEVNEASVSSERWRDHTDEVERRAVSATASDRPALLAAWLEELVFLAESEGFIPIALDRLSLEDGALSAIVAGHVGEAGRWSKPSPTTGCSSNLPRGGTVDAWCSMCEPSSARLGPP